MRKIFNGTFSYKKDIGKVRLTDEDETAIVLNPSGDALLMVADGMGGHNKGDYASQSIIGEMSEKFRDKSGFISLLGAKRWLEKIAKRVNRKLYDMSYNDPVYNGMGTTFVGALIRKNKLVILNSGDSRCYRLKNKKLEQLTEDQTYVNYLFKSGQIEEREIATHPKRHVLNNAIGLFPSCSVDIFTYDYAGESIFLCSDGLYNNVSKADIENILNTDDTTDQKVLSLINLANSNSGSDNISCALRESVDD
jgi:protein phosphatase